MMESCIKKIENLKSVFMDDDFVLIKKHLLQLLLSKNPTINLGDGFIMHIPPHRGALYVVNETWGRTTSQYENLKGTKSVLDIGGFVGDSSLFFLKNGTKNVVVCEPNYDHYSYIRKNMQANRERLSLINPDFECIPLNIGVVTDTSKDRECIGKVGSGINILQPGTNNKVPIEHINSILDLGPFEGLKMDIEGGEFPIMQRFEENPDKFIFEKGYIEFHRVYQNDCNQKTMKSLDFLERKGYEVTINDYFGKKITRDEIIEQKKYPVVMVYFQK